MVSFLSLIGIALSLVKGGLGTTFTYHHQKYKDDINYSGGNYNYHGDNYIHQSRGQGDLDVNYISKTADELLDGQGFSFKTDDQLQDRQGISLQKYDQLQDRQGVSLQTDDLLQDRQGVSLQSIEQEIEDDILQWTQELKEVRQESNKELLEKLFLRLASAGSFALGRNIKFVDDNTILVADEDEDNEDNKRRELSSWEDNLVLTEDEDLYPENGRMYVPQFIGEPLVTIPLEYLLPVIGRALVTGGFSAGSVIGLKTQELPCGLNSWNNLVSDYRKLHHPREGGRGEDKESQVFRLSQVVRRARTELSCLGAATRLHSLLDEWKIVMQDVIDTSYTARAASGISDEVLHSSIQEVYDSVRTTTDKMAADWAKSSMTTTTIILAKLAGFGMQTYGRNLGAKWTSLEQVPTYYRLTILGSALIYTIFSIDHFRRLANYKSPTCGEQDVWEVLDQYSLLLYPSEGGGDRLRTKLDMVRLRQKLTESVSCLTSTPAQFESWDTYESPLEGKRLLAKINDVLDLVAARNRV